MFIKSIILSFLLVYSFSTSLFAECATGTCDAEVGLPKVGGDAFSKIEKSLKQCKKPTGEALKKIPLDEEKTKFYAMRFCLSLEQNGNDNITDILSEHLNELRETTGYCYNLTDKIVTETFKCEGKHMLQYAVTRADSTAQLDKVSPIIVLIRNFKYDPNYLNSKGKSVLILVNMRLKYYQDIVKNAKSDQERNDYAEIVDDWKKIKEVLVESGGKEIGNG